MELGLKGKRALVCGSSQGIGKACALALAYEGADVTLFARNEASLKEVLSELNNNSSGAHNLITADFSKPKSVEIALKELIADVGNIDIVVNNTGGPPPGTAHEASADEFENAFSTHLITNQTILQLVLPRMKQNKFGRIINIISTSVKQPLDGLGVSNTIRGAVASWAKTLSNELGEFGVTVNNVLPGATETARLDAIIDKKAQRSGLSRETVIANDHKLIPMRRYGSAKEIASAVCFLASERAGYITGINLPVDGGRTKSL